MTWVDGEFWHGTWEGEQSEIRRIDPQTGEVLESLRLPEGVAQPKVVGATDEGETT